MLPQYAALRRKQEGGRKAAAVLDPRNRRADAFEAYAFEVRPWRRQPRRQFIDRGKRHAPETLRGRIARINSKTGDMVEYPLPASTNIRNLYVDDSTTPVSIWFGNNHGAAIVKLRPLD